MLDFSTFFRDMGTGPAIIGIVIVAILLYAIFSGGKGKGNGSNSGGSKPSGGSTPPPSNPTSN